MNRPIAACRIRSTAPGRTTRATMNTNNDAGFGPNLDRMRQTRKGN